MSKKRYYLNSPCYSCDNGKVLISSSHQNVLINIRDLLNKLVEENEQLKQRINRQAEQLDRLYHLIEEKDWRALSDILDDFKKCDEQLQREYGTYR